MPPRYAYWTILVDNKPTAFRAAAVEEIMPTFNRVKQRQPNAVLKWFQNGRLWDSRLDARDAMRQQREAERKPAGRPFRSAGQKLDWQPRSTDRPKLGSTGRPKFGSTGRPKFGSTDRPKFASADRPKLEWTPRQDSPAPGPKREESRPEKRSSGQRDSKWRPGGDHRDPRQKYKDAKKAKWTRFKEAVRKRRTPRKP